MLDDLSRTVREEYSRWTLVALVAMFGFFALVLAASSEALVALGIAVVFSQMFHFLLELPNVDTLYVKASMGIVVLAGSAGMRYGVATGEDGAAWFPVVTTLAGVWILFDAHRDFRDGVGHTQRDDDLSSADIMLLMNHSNLVTEELKNGPCTPSELAAACDLTESRVRDALDMMEDKDIVVRRGEQYVLDESEVGPVAFIRSNATRVLQRLARPLR